MIFYIPESLFRDVEKLRGSNAARMPGRAHQRRGINDADCGASAVDRVQKKPGKPPRDQTGKAIF
jgi:hypothetical protein